MDKYAFSDCVDLVGSACTEFSGEKYYVSTGAVNEDHINWSAVERVDYTGKPSRANLSVETGDILFAKMQGTKKTLYITEELSENIYSSGFCAVRPCSKLLTSKCLFYLLTSKTFLNQKDKYCSGATQKAITNSGLQKIFIILPPIDQQISIAKQLDLISNIIKTKESELQKLDDLVKAKFVEMFGDPLSNPNGLPTKKLSELGSLDRGRSKHRPRNAPELLDGPYPLIQTGDVAAAGLYITEYHSTYSELGLKQSKMWKAGTLCITIAANIAETAIMTFDACFPDSVVGFVPNGEVSSVYMHYWFDFFQRILEEQAPQVAQKNINLKILSDLSVIVPQQDQLHTFEDFVFQVDKSKVAVQRSLNETQILFDSLMQKYFG